MALQNLDVTFAVDRAGLVGEDGPTHAGSFDISYLRCIPNMAIATPSDENECRQLLFSAYRHKGPSAVRYPRGGGTGAEIVAEDLQFALGKGRELRKGIMLSIFNFGVLLPRVQGLAEKHNFSVCDMRWAKPLDEELILRHAMEHDYLVTLEENAIAGGVGSGVVELLTAHGIHKPVLQLGLEDKYYEHGKRDELLQAAGLDEASIEGAIQHWLKRLNKSAGSNILGVK